MGSFAERNVGPQILVLANEWTCTTCGETVVAAIFESGTTKGQRPPYCPRCEAEERQAVLVPTLDYLRPGEWVGYGAGDW